jgi:hypothetical protein
MTDRFLIADLRYQFLKSAVNLIDTPQFREFDALGAAFVSYTSLEVKILAQGHSVYTHSPESVFG